MLGVGQARAANLPSNCTQSGTTVACTFSPGPEGTFAVPAGVTSLHVVAAGEAGAFNIQGVAGGPGAQVTADLGVSAGSTLFVEVAIGGGTAGSSHAGRGGGESDLRTCSISDASCPALGTARDPRLLVAAGGGGAGDGSQSGTGGAAGAGTNTCNPGSDGGPVADPDFGKPGKGGGCNRGGAGGAAGNLGLPGGDGTAGSGGAGGSGVVIDGGGGGGGSSYGPTGSVFTHAATGPQVVISYTPAPTPTASTATPTATPSALALAPTGGPDLRLPLIGLTVIVAGLALFLISAGRRRPSAGR